MTTPTPDIPADLRPAYEAILVRLRYYEFITEDTILAQVSQPTQTPFVRRGDALGQHVVRVQDMSGLVLELESFGLISNSGLVWTLTTLGARWLNEQDTSPEPFVVNPEPIRTMYEQAHQPTTNEPPCCADADTDRPKVVDLMEALEASLAAARAQHPARKP